MKNVMVPSIAASPPGPECQDPGSVLCFFRGFWHFSLFLVFLVSGFCSFLFYFEGLFLQPVSGQVTASQMDPSLDFDQVTLMYIYVIHSGGGLPGVLQMFLSFSSGTDGQTLSSRTFW